jgi:hypothetical protein
LCGLRLYRCRHVLYQEVSCVDWRCDRVLIQKTGSTFRKIT